MTQRITPIKSLTTQTLQGGAWQLVSVVAQAVLQIAVLAILARHVSPEEFGLVAIAGIATSLATMLGQIGLGPAIIQRSQISQLHIRVAHTTSIILGGLSVSILWICAPFIANFFEAPAVTLIVKIISLSFLFASVGVTADALLQRELEFRKILVVDLISYIVGYILVAIPLAILDYGVWSIVLGTVAQSLTKSSILLLFHPHNLLPSFSMQELRDLLGYGTGLTFTRLFNYGALQGDYFIVGRTLSTTALGIYERTFRIIFLPGRYIGDVIDRVMFPAMAKVQDDPERLANSYLRAINIVHLCLSPVSVIMVVLAPEIINVILGPSWQEAVLPLQILSLSIPFRTTVRVCDSLVRAVGAVYQSAARKALFAILVVLGSWIGHFWRLEGVAIAVTIATAVNFLLMMHLGLVLTGIHLKTFISMLTPGTSVSLLTLVVSAATCHLLRIVEIAPFVILVSTILTTITTAGLVTIIYPPLIGDHAGWLVEKMIGMLYGTRYYSILRKFVKPGQFIG